ncbi:GntR family transcriptional regulator [Qipengyuania sp. 6B39]|uniref:GntR family transcriptional regulator n=1 Tax=Qipengyuania proteolytica TaxID=2867239 RepID=UPI001C89DFB9|nr:GntR family transcriptional regulator [Qipengyuania proteolytica]MBX7495130.1 GntR family transcriptional regulator [Qipengyuania proteolytica]
MSRASDRAYSTIREMIMSGELAPGDPLGEEALAERCGVSRTPVRDALRRLEADMLVSRTDTQRSFVADWSLDDIADVFELRAMLEGHAAQRAAERMDDGTLKALRRCNSALRDAVQASPPDVDRFLERNKEFHALIIEAAGSRKLVSLLASVIEQPVVWRTAHHYGAEELRRSCGEHDELLAAFARRDGAWANAIMSGHIRRAFHAYADAHRGLTAIDNRARRRTA